MTRDELVEASEWTSAFLVSFDYPMGRDTLTDICILFDVPDLQTVELRMTGDVRDTNHLESLAIAIAGSVH